MQFACIIGSMETALIQVRNVPGEVHQELKRRAKRRRQSLNAYVLSLLERDVAVAPASLAGPGDWARDEPHAEAAWGAVDSETRRELSRRARLQGKNVADYVRELLDREPAGVDRVALAERM